ncbi:MAG: amino acid ABC transporter ATP-binding protein, partial [Pseudomonadota bacterium]
NDDAVLDVRKLTKSFGQLEVLRGISLTAHRGDVISILGASGSGKSTFLRCLNGLETPSAGEVRLEGAPVFGQARISAKDAAHNCARMPMVFQGFNLWTHMTVLENVTSAPVHVLGLAPAEARERAMHVLDRVAIADKADAYPAALSGGQQQRVAIARALAMSPALILFDEPTSALDPELVGDVLKVMRKLAEEHVTMLVVTHELAFARDVSSSVVFLHEGQIEEQGTPAELFTRQSSTRFRDFLAASAHEPRNNWE